MPTQPQDAAALYQHLRAQGYTTEEALRRADDDLARRQERARTNLMAAVEVGKRPPTCKLCGVAIARDSPNRQYCDEHSRHPSGLTLPAPAPYEPLGLTNEEIHEQVLPRVTPPVPVLCPRWQPTCDVDGGTLFWCADGVGGTRAYSARARALRASWLAGGEA